MKLMRCPLNGWRGVAEFMYGGVVEDIPDPDACDDRAWSDYLFIRENRRGPVADVRRRERRPRHGGLCALPGHSLT